MKKTVETYENDEVLEKSIGEEIKKKGVFRSVILPLILSLIAAIGIWTYVSTENNLVSGVPLRVNGSEALQDAGYTVSAIEPLSVDVVLSGKAEVIKKATKDHSMITAIVNVFKSDTGDDKKDYYIFASAEDIKPGPYTVKVTFTLPDGVTCADKEVSVIISEITQPKS